jgi:hypothetical protein
VYAYIAENGLVGHLFILHSPFFHHEQSNREEKSKENEE